MEEKVIRPNGLWRKYGWLMFGLLMFCIIMFVTISISDNDPENTVGYYLAFCLPVGIVTGIVFVYMAFIHPKKKIVFDINNAFNSYVVLHGKLTKVSIQCTDFINVKVKSGVMELRPHLITSDGKDFVMSSEVYSKEQLYEIIEEIQKRGGLIGQNIKF